MNGINSAREGYPKTILHIPQGKSYRCRPNEIFPQKGALFDCSWYYAVMMAGDRWGKENHGIVRMIEILFSRARKVFSSQEFQGWQSWIFQILNKEGSKAITLSDSASDIRRKLESMNLSQERVSRDDFFEQTIKAFLSQSVHTTYHAYLMRIRSDTIVDIVSEILEGLDRILESYVPRFRAFSSPLRLRQFQEALAHIQEDKRREQLAYRILRDCAADTLVELTFADWNPGVHNIEHLKREIDEFGPMSVEGAFGPQFYEDPPSRRETDIEGKPVYYWPVGSKRQEGRERVSMVVLVGADDYWVYYIDPHESSQERRVYAISYDELCQRAQKIHDSIHFPLTSNRYDRAAITSVLAFGYRRESRQKTTSDPQTS